MLSFNSWAAVLAVVAALALAAPSAGAQAIEYVDETGTTQYNSVPLAVTDEELASVGKTTTASEPNASPALVVDGPPEVECPQATFVSIQAAVTAAPPGSTIEVCPGQYNESVIVPKPLTLFAPRHRGEATKCPSGPADDPTRYAIVDSPGLGDGFRLEADGIVLEGFVEQGNARGIVTDPGFSGYLIRHTIAQNNTFGVAFDTSGGLESALERSCLRDNFEGVFSISLQNARIEENAVTGNRVGIEVFSGSANVTLIHNDLIDNSDGIDLRGVNVVFRYNHLRRSGLFVRIFSSDFSYNLVEDSRTGIFMEEGRDNVVRSNHVRDSGRGLTLLQVKGNIVRGNISERNRGDGIIVEAGFRNTLENNLSRDNGGDGLLVENSFDNTFEHNTVIGNGADGLRATDRASGNTFERNTLLGNGEHDCHDDTIGPGTAGTANFWIRDIGKTENRAGLCSQRPNS